MAITLEEDRKPGAPVIRRFAIGERFRGAVVKTEQRDMTKDVDGVRQKVLKADGSPRQEIVITMVTIKSTMEAGRAEDASIPEPGTIVRAIHKGGAFASWIDAKKALGRSLQVGDIYEESSDYAHTYDPNGKETGKFTTQEEVANFRRLKAEGRKTDTLGFRGSMTLRPAKPDEAQWVAAAEAAYMAAKDPFPAEPAFSADDF